MLPSTGEDCDGTSHGGEDPHTARHAGIIMLTVH